MAVVTAVLVVGLLLVISGVAEGLAVIQEMAVTAQAVHILQLVIVIPVLGVQVVRAVHGNQIAHLGVVVAVVVLAF